MLIFMKFWAATSCHSSCAIHRMTGDFFSPIGPVPHYFSRENANLWQSSQPCLEICNVSKLLWWVKSRVEFVRRCLSTCRNAWLGWSMAFRWTRSEMRWSEDPEDATPPCSAAIVTRSQSMTDSMPARHQHDMNVAGTNHLLVISSSDTLHGNTVAPNPRPIIQISCTFAPNIDNEEKTQLRVRFHHSYYDTPDLRLC